MTISHIHRTYSHYVKLHTLPINTVSFSDEFWTDRQSIVKLVYIILR